MGRISRNLVWSCVCAAQNPSEEMWVGIRGLSEHTALCASWWRLALPSSKVVQGSCGLLGCNTEIATTTTTKKNPKKSFICKKIYIFAGICSSTQWRWCAKCYPLALEQVRCKSHASEHEQAGSGRALALTKAMHFHTRQLSVVLRMPCGVPKAVASFTVSQTWP